MSKLILVSAGHSAVDPGAVGNGFKEADIALSFRDRTAAILRGKGLSVIEDGADGVNEPLAKAIVLAKKSDIAVEFHLNASANPQANGVECLSLEKHKAFAQKLSGAIAAETNGKLRGYFGWLDQSAGQHHRLGFCVAGGIIIELGFISNKTELTKLLEKQESICQRIADVIAEKAGFYSPASTPNIPASVPTPATAEKSADFYVVKAGDTASGIARRFGLELLQLKRLNNLNDKFEIRAGDKLKVK